MLWHLFDIIQQNDVKIQVTKTFLPPIEEYQAYVAKIWENNWLTNNGPFVIELEQKLAEFLKVPYVLFVSNGTIAIQLALKALNITGEVITTPFSYCATTTSLLWENCQPVFVDIHPEDLNIDASLIESKITSQTQAILATHVYGRPCQVEKIQEIGQKYGIPVLYDGAHAFGSTVHGQQVLSFGDVATCSFHATKVFHTIEGGCIVVHDEALYEKLKHYRSFGHKNDNYFTIGINGKNSEFHAVMGLTNLPHLPRIMAGRKAAIQRYEAGLDWSVFKQPHSRYTDFTYNQAYFPLILPTEAMLLEAFDQLGKLDIVPRRYFYPSLNELPYLSFHQSCPVSEDISKRVLSLPLYADIPEEVVDQVVTCLNSIATT